jgi:hypothetical protein
MSNISYTIEDFKTGVVRSWEQYMIGEIVMFNSVDDFLKDLKKEER